jgi:hypothetical protein
MLKDIRPEIFEKMTGLPRGYLTNVADESQFTQDNFRVPDLINFKNTKKHYEFIKDYVDCIIKSLTSS